MSKRILVIDDDALILKHCFDLTGEPLQGIELEFVTSLDAALPRLVELNFAIVFLDVSFTSGGMEGIEFLKTIRNMCPTTHIIMMTSHSDQKTITQCLSLGADDYFVKSKSTYSVLIERIKAVFEREKEEHRFEEEGRKIASSIGAVFSSQAMAEVFAKVARARRETSLHVLITGPTGAGKEVIAKAIGRSCDGAPYYPLNCSNFGKELFESELFGHEKGSFTGADRRKIGLFEEASNGDIFLDEVARLSLDHQAKLLRAVQSGEYLRLGGNEIRESSTRVIAATNEDLQGMVARGEFREDLLHRLKQFVIEIPSLSSRREDVPVLINHFISLSSKPDLQVSNDCLNLLKNHPWPGNVRQLENVVRKVVLKAVGIEITIGDLPRELFGQVEIEDANNSYSHAVEHGTCLEVAVDAFRAGYIRQTASHMKNPTIEGLAQKLASSKSATGRYVKRYGIKLSNEFRQGASYE